MKKRARTFSGTPSNEATPLELKNRLIAGKAAEEGIVLLKNEGLLPLDKHAKTALFGCGANHLIKGGTGSGDVNEREVVSIYQGMKNAGFCLAGESWIADYDAEYTRARESWRDNILEETEKRGGVLGFFDVYSTHPFMVPAGRGIEAADVDGAETAVYVVSRVAGEGADRRDVRGDYYLLEEEREQLRQIAALCGSIVVLLNVGGPIDLSEILEIPQVKAVLLISQPGMEGGTAVAKVLAGEVVPSGKLTDTWTKRYEDYANSDTFGFKTGDLTKTYYEDGIYVGYRYFDTFGVEPLYPFGYGLSYTSFAMETGEILADGEKVQVSVKVTNTGETFSGKEVVQIYAVCPQTGLTKEWKRLCGYGKTSELCPGESQTVIVEMGVDAFTSYDESRSAWILEKGSYVLLAGNSSASAEAIGVLHVEETIVYDQVTAVCPLQEELHEISPDRDILAAEHEKLVTQTLTQEKLASQTPEQSKPVLIWRPEPRKRSAIPQNAYDEMADALIAKLNDEQLTMMTIGEVTSSHNIALGAAGIMVPGAAGETCSILDRDYDVPGIAVADGPAGIRVMQQYQADEENSKIYTQGFLGAMEHGYFAEKLDVPGTKTYYQYCTAVPVGTMLAQTWNISLVEEVGRAVGEEMAFLGITLWLAPGMNIHRNPLCGRNFEYYSEDPLVSGAMAAAITRGVQTVPGVGTTIKHFACNNQEDNRNGCDSILSERALREIYLRGFEIAVRTSQPMSIMTSYNLINGVHTANSKDLCTTVAREEWDFQGAIMTDWLTTASHGGSLSWKCVAAGNELIMPGIPEDKENILEALQSGALKREELEGCVHRLLKVIYQSLGYEECRSYGEQFGF